MWPIVRDVKPKVLILDCSAIPDIEYTALKMLTEAEEKLREEGVSLWLAALNPEVQRVIARSSLGEVLGRERVFFNSQQAVQRYHANMERTQDASPGIP